MKKKVLLVSSMYRNGGITSWTQKYLKNFHRDDYELLLVASDPKREAGESFLFQRITSGLGAMWRIMKGVRHIIKREHVDIVHKATSGSLGALTDWLLGKYCKIYGVKSILHCHYGCIPEVLRNGGFIGRLTLKSMQQFDQIWILDNRTLNYLKQRSDIKGEIKLTPNFIEVNENLVIEPKTYSDIAFIGNLVPEKGLFELVKAVKSVKQNIRLHIVGDGATTVLDLLKQLVGDDIGVRIKLYGRLPNVEAIKFMQSIDIVALPSYMESEAFPISILEAMSLGKLVISTRRAAIADMLTGLDGSPCGIFVRERNVKDIEDAITWCLNNPAEADKLCQKAYEKVYALYRTEVVCKLYASFYKELV